jgi:hypothetical protein
MSPASVFPPGGLVSAPARDDPAARTPPPGLRGGGEDLPDPYVGEPKWAAWKITLFVILFCGGFWAGVAWLLMRLFG